jgi:hypothetical protein
MSTSGPSQNSFWQRLGRAFLNTLKLLLFVAIVVAIAAGAWLGYRELVRSLNVIADRADLNAQRIEVMRRDVDDLMTDTSQEEMISSLQEVMATQEAQIADLQTRLDDDVARQEEALQDLQLQVTALISHTEVLTGNVATLREGVVALQGDVNENRSAIDELGGDLDTLRLALASLDEQFQQVSEDAGELATMREALTLFRVWELVARARLYLAEGNAGLAASDLDAATLVVDGLVGALEAGSESSLRDLQARLSLARDSLPDDPATAERDLATAWETLDALLADRLADATSLDPGTTITPTLTVTATVTATSSLTPAPTGTPTSTPQP